MEDPSHDRIERDESLAKQQRQVRAAKESVLDSVGNDLTDAVKVVIEEVSANVAVDSTSGDGATQTLTARLAWATPIARILDEFATDRFARLETLDVVDIDGGMVSPGSNFSKL